MSMQI